MSQYLVDRSQSLLGVPMLAADGTQYTPDEVLYPGGAGDPFILCDSARGAVLVLTMAQVAARDSVERLRYRKRDQSITMLRNGIKMPVTGTPLFGYARAMGDRRARSDTQSIA